MYHGTYSGTHTVAACAASVDRVQQPRASPLRLHDYAKEHACLPRADLARLMRGDGSLEKRMG
eukprot:2219903-Pleurochrysis_carterae.AAC.1